MVQRGLRASAGGRAQPVSLDDDSIELGESEFNRPVARKPRKNGKGGRTREIHHAEEEDVFDEFPTLPGGRAAPASLDPSPAGSPTPAPP